MTMSRVVGIGGVFIKARNPAALCEWYREHLGMDIEKWGGMAFNWNRPDGPGEKGLTIWSVFEESSSYFAPSTARFMINFIVKDLEDVLQELRSEGCEVDTRTEDSEHGKFGWVMDPEGNRVELWQPPDRTAGPSADS
jgi:catechol 2,3-dioxygenase-like lactoylglutathione lyase family enzyme